MRKIVSYAASLAFIFGAFFFLIATPTLARDPGVAGTPDAADAQTISGYCADKSSPAACDSCLAVAIAYGTTSQAGLSGLNCATKTGAELASCQSCQASGFISSLPDTIINNVYQKQSLFAGADATANVPGVDVGVSATSGPNDNDDKDVSIKGQELNFVGSPNCGLPEPGLDGNTTVTKCCATPPDMRAALTERAVNIIPRILCPPDWIGAPLSSVTSGLFSGPVGAIGTGVSVLKNIFGSDNDEKEGPEWCFTDVVRIATAKVVSVPAFLLVDDKALPQRACVESAIPVIGGNRLALESEYKDPSCKCTYPEDVEGGVLADEITQSFCSKYINQDEFPDEYDGCVACQGVWTGMGCIGTDLGKFVGSMLRIGLGISFGAAFIVMLYSAYLLQTSQGNPEKVRKAREYLNSAIIGILVVIFAAFILQLVGVEILRIPGLDSLPSATSN